MTEMVSGGLLLARILRAHGQETVYTLHGGHLDAFYVECADAGIALIDTRHEASAGHAADAHAGRAATAVVTSGQVSSTLSPRWAMPNSTEFRCS